MSDVPASNEVHEALTRLMREESGRVVALLTQRFGSLDLADEAVQDALVQATQTWPADGVPDNPAGWLLTVARRKALDRIRRTGSAYRRTMAAAPELVVTDDAPQLRDAQGGAYVETNSEIDEVAVHGGDPFVRLVLLCCHPALDRDSQVALTLRLVGGLTTAEIAAAFVLPEPTLAQRIVRAKRKIRDAAIPLTIPAMLDSRIDSLATVLYLIFNEGYLSRGDHDGVVRVDLIDEAIRLTKVVGTLLPDRAELDGLLALELFQAARVGTRVSADNELVLLEDQDRSRWDLAMISEANRVLRRAMGRMAPGSFQMQAVIAGYHANARTPQDTDWTAIARVYGQLEQMMPNDPIVSLNRAVAVAMADGPQAGLALLDAIAGLDRYHLLHAARGELLARAGHFDHAAASFETALGLTENPAEQRHLRRRREAAAERRAFA